MKKIISKIALWLGALVVATSLTTAATSAPAQAASLNVLGFSVTTPQTMYFPTGCSSFEFAYQNNTGFALLQVGYIFMDPYGDRIANDSLIGAPSGGSGVWDEQICAFDLKNGLGPYKLKVYVEDYSSRGGNTREQVTDIYFTARPNQVIPAPSWPAPPANTGVTTLDVYGFSVSFNNDLYMPDGCSNYEFRYVNNTGFELLQVGYLLTNRYGDSIASDSLIGSPSGGNGVWNEQICKFDLDDTGPYTLKAYVQDYSSRGGNTRQRTVNFYFKNRPLPGLTKAPTPVLVGNMEVGSVLTANAGSWDTGVGLTYAWLRSGVEIPGATGSTYLLTGEDLGSSISVKITGSKNGYSSTSMTSSASKSVTQGRFASTPIPKISGTLKVGKSLVASTGSWDSQAQLNFQWIRNGVEIPGANSNRYLLTKTDKGKTLKVRITAVREYFETATVFSATTKKIG